MQVNEFSQYRLKLLVKEWYNREYGNLAEGETAAELAAELQKYAQKAIDAGDERALAKALLSFKRSTLESICDKVFKQRKFADKKREKSVIALVNVLLEKGITITQAADFFKKVKNRSFGLEKAFTVGLHKIDKLIPKDPVLDLIWQDLYKETAAFSGGMASAGSGEFLLTILGANDEHRGKEAQGLFGNGDISLPDGASVEVKAGEGGYFFARSKKDGISTNYRFNEKAAETCFQVLKSTGLDRFFDKTELQNVKKLKTDRPDLNDKVINVMLKNGAKRKEVVEFLEALCEEGYTAAMPPSIISRFMSAIKKCVNSKGQLNAEKWSSETMPIMFDAYKDVKGWKYCILYNKKKGLDRFAIIEKGSDIKGELISCFRPVYYPVLFSREF